MKKLFLILILLCNLILVKTLVSNQVIASDIHSEVTKPLILRLGDDYYKYLRYDGYDMIFNNVNFNKVGTYYVTYKHLKTNKELTKTVYVKDKEELLLQRTYFEQKDEILKFNSGDNIQMVKEYNGEYYLSYLEAAGDKNHLRFVRVGESGIKFNICAFINSPGRIVDYIVDGEEIALIVEHATGEEYQDLYFMVLDMKGNKTYTRKYEGSGIESGVKILSDQDNYYVVLNTTSSSEGDFSFQHSMKSGVIFVIDKATKEEVDVQEICEDFDVEIIDASIYLDNLTLVYQYYDSSIKLKYIYLFEYSYMYEIANKHYFEGTLTKNISKLSYNSSGNLYLATRDYNQDISDYVTQLYEISSKYKGSKIYEYQYPKVGNCNLVDMSISDSNNINLLYSLVDTSRSEPYGYLYQSIVDDKVMVEFEEYGYVTMAERFIGSDKLLFVNETSVIIDNIHYAVFTSLQDKIVSTHYNIENCDPPSLFVNGEKAQLDLTKSELQFDKQEYGKYDALYYFTTEDVDVITYGTVEILPYTNVYEKGVFDTNVTLEFNAKATLNSYEIEDGYTVTSPGSYLLVLTANSGEKHLVNFEVRELTNNETILNDDNITIQTNDKTYDSDSNILITNHIKEEDLVIEKNNRLWMLLIPLTSLVGLGTVIFSKRG